MSKLVAKFRLRDGEKESLQVFMNVTRPRRWMVEVWSENSASEKDTVKFTTKESYFLRELVAERIGEEIDTILKSARADGSSVVAIGWRAWIWG